MPVPAAYLERAWPLLVGFVEAAARENAHLIGSDAYRDRIAARDMQLWAIRKGNETVGALITEVYDSQAGRTCGIPICSGRNMTEWLHLLEELRVWARENGCVRMECNGRAGWERALKRFGWRVISTQVAIEI